MSRLASLYSARGKVRESVELLSRLRESAPTTKERRECQIRISSVYEQNGNVRDAENELDDLRRRSPLRLEVLTSLVDFYQRQGASSALSMHLTRSSADLRRAIDRDPQNEALWNALIRMVLTRHGTQCAARVTDAAASVGVIDLEFAKTNETPRTLTLDLQGNDASLADRLAPPALSAPLRQCFNLTASAMDKILPFDAKAWRATKASARSNPLVAEAVAVGKLLGISGLKILTTDVAPRVCVPVATKPPTLVIGRDLGAIVDESGRRFLFARALTIAAAGLAPAMRVPADEISNALAGLIVAFEPTYSPTEVDVSKLGEIAKRWGKLIRRRDWDEVGSLGLELAGRNDFRPLAVALAAAELGNRVALLALGETQAAINALLVLSGKDVAQADLAGRMQAILDTPEAWSVLRFAISEEYLDLVTSQERQG